MRSIFNIGLALKNIRNRFFHTFLSILGMVIGVAALVGTLSLIDGMEQFAKKQISANTSLQTIQLRSQTFKLVNGIRIRKDSFPVLTYPVFRQMVSQTEGLQRGLLRHTRPGEIHLVGSPDSMRSASFLSGVARWGKPFPDEEQDYTGRTLDEADVTEKRLVCLLNATLAKGLAGEEEPRSMLGQRLETPYGQLEIVGLGTREEERVRPNLFFPITLIPEDRLREEPPMASIEAADVTRVNAVKDSLSGWLTANLQATEGDFQLQTNAFWVGQAEKGFLLFRVIMGMIVGLSVLVGGIGIMNVMLITVKDRTPEIGICKAMGARRRDIFLQYLSESITISSLGSFLGLVLGLLGTLAAVPIIKSIADVPFEAAYTLNTLMVIVSVAILVGVLFGTYPALTASRLDPVEAMRRE